MKSPCRNCQNEFQDKGLCLENCEEIKIFQKNVQHCGCKARVSYHVTYPKNTGFVLLAKDV